MRGNRFRRTNGFYARVLPRVFPFGPCQRDHRGGTRIAMARLARRRLCPATFCKFRYRHSGCRVRAWRHAPKLQMRVTIRIVPSARFSLRMLAPRTDAGCAWVCVQWCVPLMQAASVAMLFTTGVYHGAHVLGLERWAVSVMMKRRATVAARQRPLFTTRKVYYSCTPLIHAMRRAANAGRGEETHS